ncbi:MAG: hypothetical protein PVF52_03720 [Granulosicoccaceae bacterium]|jgi:hypothetical protein
MQDNCLVITPCDPQASLPAVDDMLALLRDIGLAADGFDWHGAQHYLPGERFLDLITFLGCSPSINIEPSGDGSEFCHIAIARYDTPQVFAADNARTPRCLHCKQELPNWRDWQYSPLVEYACPHCGEPLRLDRLNWRRTVAIARGALYIYGVHDSEAVPSELLLLALEKHTGKRWAYCYQQHK